MVEVICRPLSLLFFFNDTATTEIYTLSLHDALPIFQSGFCMAGKTVHLPGFACLPDGDQGRPEVPMNIGDFLRSEEHTSELQSRLHLVCRLLLEKKKSNDNTLSLFNIFAASTTTSAT